MRNVLVSPVLLVGIIVALLISVGVLMQTQKMTENSPKGFVLPVGDSVRGQQAFLNLGCVNCHTVNGVKFDVVPGVVPDAVIPLGGEKPVAVSYGKLVTSIIHPTESIMTNLDRYVDSDGQSFMPEYKSVMTVEQMADLVAFLQGHYDVKIPEYHHNYPNVGYPY